MYNGLSIRQYMHIDLLPHSISRVVIPVVAFSLSHEYGYPRRNSFIPKLIFAPTKYTQTCPHRDNMSICIILVVKNNPIDDDTAQL